MHTHRLNVKFEDLLKKSGQLGHQQVEAKIIREMRYKYSVAGLRGENTFPRYFL